MRIAHIVCSYPPYYGGMGNVVFSMAEQLVGLGHEVDVFTPQYYEPKEIRPEDAPEAGHHAPEVVEQQATVHRLAPSLHYGNAARMPQLGHELDDFDLVHLHYPFFGTANLVRRWKKKNPNKPLFITYHMDTRGPGWKGLIFKNYSRYWMPKILGVADRLLVSSFDYIEASDAKHLYTKHKEMWRELPFGVDIERFAPRPKPQDLIASLGLDPNLPIILFVGGMDAAHYFKGIPHLLSAAYLLHHAKVPAQYVLVGDGELREQFESRVEALGISSFVHFAGHVSDDELHSYYNLADFLVLPSLHRGEAFGMVLLEALASGVPVIASDLPGVRTVAKHAGFVVPPGRAPALAHTLQEAISMGGDTYVELSMKARAIAEKVYAWEPIVERLDAMYKEFAKES